MLKPIVSTATEVEETAVAEALHGRSGIEQTIRQTISNQFQKWY
jgi:hypothetical protein